MLRAHGLPDHERWPVLWLLQQHADGRCGAKRFRFRWIPQCGARILGRNLRNKPGAETGAWSGSDFKGNTAPTALDGVSVSIGGQAAFVDYISAGQVNAQLPSNIATGGPLQLTVANGGATGAPVNITVNATQPGLLAPGSFKIGGNQYLVALLPDGTYVLPAGSIAGVNSRAAHPGETITLYGVGFGSVTPAFPAGQIVTQDNELALPLPDSDRTDSRTIDLLWARARLRRAVPVRCGGSGSTGQQSGAADV